MEVKIPCQDCHGVKRIDVLLSCMLHCAVPATWDGAAEPGPRGILPLTLSRGLDVKTVAPAQRGWTPGAHVWYKTAN